MDIWLTLLVFLVAIGTSVLSGLSGGGAGFITVPFLIFLGIPPANTLAITKVGALGTALGSLTALRGKGLVDKRYIVLLCSIMLVSALVAAWLIPRIDPETFKGLIGWTLLFLAPTVLIKKKSFQPGPRTKRWIWVGIAVFAIVSFGTALLGTGIGSLVVLVFMYLFGMDALRAAATKRVTQSVQAIVLAVLLTLQGLLLWHYAIASLIGATIGTYIGTKYAIKRGANFVKYTLAVLMVASGAAMLLL